MRYLFILLSLCLYSCSEWDWYYIPGYSINSNQKQLAGIRVKECFYIGSIDSSHFHDKNILFYEMDIKAFNKADLIKYFIIAYNKRYKTNYNAMVDISIKKSFVFLDNGELYDIQGLLLNIKK